MSTGNDILEELRSMGSPLADMSRAMPYHVPKHYFGQLSGNINESVAAEESDDIQLSVSSRAMPYQVPSGYFESFPKLITDIVIAGEPQLSLPKAATLDVPTGYFDALPEKMLAAAKASETPEHTTQTIPLGRRVSRSIRLAVAAILVLGIGFSAYKIFWQSSGAYNPEKALAQVPENAINEYVQQNIDDFDMELLENTIAANINIDPSNTDILSDEEIILYLDETGWDQTIIN